MSDPKLGAEKTTPEDAGGAAAASQPLAPGSSTGEEREAKRAAPPRIGEDEHGRYFRINLIELVVGVLAIVLAIISGYAFLWSELKEVREKLSKLSEGDVQIKAYNSNLGQDLHETQARLENWYVTVFTDYCTFHGGDYIARQYACKFKDGRAPLPFRAMQLRP